MVNKKRAKENGEFFTPPELINKLLDELPIDIFQPGENFLEPAAGDGNIVIEYLRRKMFHGCTPTQALADTYAVEYMRDNFDAMCQRVLDFVGDTEEHRQIVSRNFAHANYLDPKDVSDGRCYPWFLKNKSTIDL